MLCGAMTASAEDVVQVVPFQTVANVTNDGWDKTFSLNLKNESQTVNIIYFEMYLPKGLDLNTVYDSDEDGTFAGEIDENNPRCIKVVGPKKNKTNHVVAYNNVDHLPAYQRDGYTCYTVLISQGTTTIPFQGTDGEIATFQYVTGDIAPGVYPIYLENIELTDQANKIKLPIASTTSYVVIGEPTGANVKLEGMVPSWVNTALAGQTGISNLDLTAVTAVNGTFTYIDGRDVAAPTADFTATAAYSKAVASGKYASLTMPFAADLTGKGAYVLGSVTGTTANFTEAKSVNAGDVVLLTQSVDLEGTKLGAVASTVKGEAYYVAPDGSELRKGTNVTVPALRGTWDVVGGASNLRIALDGVLTDINMVDVQGEGAQAFDLQGRQVQNAQNGVFVVNGKKQFVK